MTYIMYVSKYVNEWIGHKKLIKVLVIKVLIYHLYHRNIIPVCKFIISTFLYDADVIR